MAESAAPADARVLPAPGCRHGDVRRSRFAGETAAGNLAAGLLGALPGVAAGSPQGIAGGYLSRVYARHPISPCVFAEDRAPQDVRVNGAPSRCEPAAIHQLATQWLSLRRLASTVRAEPREPSGLVGGSGCAGIRHCGVRQPDARLRRAARARLADSACERGAAGRARRRTWTRLVSRRARVAMGGVACNADDHRAAK